MNLDAAQYSAIVKSVLPEVEPDTCTQIIVLQLKSATLPQLKPGQTMQVELSETIATGGIWVPTSALTQDIRGLWSVFVVVPTDDDDAYEVQPQSVKILPQESVGVGEAAPRELVAQNRPRVSLQGTLQVGDRIVANGVHRWVPDRLVRPLE